MIFFGSAGTTMQNLTDADVDWLRQEAERRWPGDGEEIAQEACLRVLDGVNGYRPGNWRGWLLKVLRNAAATYFRREHRHRHAEQRPGAEPAHIPAPSLPPEVRIIDLLPAPYKAVAHMVLVVGWSYAETAERLGIPLGTVCSRVNRARRALVPHRKLLWRVLIGGVERQGKRSGCNGANHGTRRA